MKEKKNKNAAQEKVTQPPVEDATKKQEVPWLDEPRTTVRAAKPGIFEAPTSKQEMRTTVIDPGCSYPERKGLRYTLSEEHLGKLECLARSRFEIGEIKKDLDLTKWEASGGRFYPEIAQSVNASSAIEDEGIAADQLGLLLTAATDAKGNYADDELQRRQTAVKCIYEAQLWALTNPYREWISFDFILGLHFRMFETTRRKSAGKLKSEAVHIFGGPYDIQTLPAAKTEGFLRSLCERTNCKFDLAAKHAEVSMFLTCAEFVVDFLAIHPFSDGNGRAARVLSTYLLERSGYHFARFYDLDSIILERREDYYAALFNAQRNWYSQDEDLTPWVTFYIDAVFNQWQRAYRRVREESLRRKRRQGD